MRVLWVSFALVVADQLTKWWVRATLYPGESVPVLGDVFRLTYTTNPGMAFGLELGSKLFLSLFSIFATVLIGGYLWYVRKGPWGYRLALAGIIGGAVGNIIDRTFYGVWFDYAPLFYGEVVDFIHVNLWRGSVDFPLLGTKYVSLFPIWNVADMAIVVGVATIILFQRRFSEGLAEAELREREAPAPADAAAVEALPEAPAPAAPSETPADSPPPPRV